LKTGDDPDERWLLQPMLVLSLHLGSRPLRRLKDEDSMTVCLNYYAPGALVMALPGIPVAVLISVMGGLEGGGIKLIVG
jgi:hypothetical protein